MTIEDESHIFIRRGGTINLTCRIKLANLQEELTWYNNGTSIAPDQTQWMSSQRICSTKGRKKFSIETLFNLVIEAVDLGNCGAYECAAGNSQPDRVFRLQSGEEIGGWALKKGKM